MNKDRLKNIVVAVVSYLYVLLFVYAAVSKLLDFENFQVQLGQSPLLSAFAGYVAWLVPAVEILISLLLVIPRFRKIGLLASYILMIMFTAYIYIILNYSSFIPCSCGGVLEKMSWNEHLIFNVVFVLFAGLGYFFIPTAHRIDTAFSFLTSKIIVLFLGGSLGILIVVIGYQFSENIIHHHNNFVRRFPQHYATPVEKIDLKYNSYYFAGYGDGKIYLGNYTTPLQILEIDEDLKHKIVRRIDLDDLTLAFKEPQIAVEPPYFYFYEGAVPYLYSGTITDWRATLRFKTGDYFSQLKPIDQDNVAVRFIEQPSGESILGSINLIDTVRLKERKLLERQFDGIFDTDGKLAYNKTLKKLVYVYYYRNQYILFSSDLHTVSRGNTIDTTSRADVKLVTITSKNKTTYSKPPRVVNNSIATDGNILYVHSTLPGQFEDLKIWKRAIIIDMYQLQNKSYLSSFYLHDESGEKVKSFIVDGSNLYGLVGTKLVKYQLKKDIKIKRP